MRSKSNTRCVVVVAVAVASLLIVGCATKRVILPPESNYSGRALTVEQFNERPFGHAETLDDFARQLVGVKLTKMVRRNLHNSELVDTIYEYNLARGGKIMLYQTSYGQQFLLGAVITSDDFVLRNGLKVGMREEEVRAIISDLPKMRREMMIETEEGKRTLKLEFSLSGKLKKISIYSHLD